MKLLLLLSLIVLTSGDEALVAERTAEANDVFPQTSAGVFEVQPGAQEVLGEKKLGKRSYGLHPASSYTGSYAPSLPWYRLGGLSSYGLYGGWYPSWPLLYGGGGGGWHGGWHGGWYRGW